LFLRGGCGGRISLVFVVGLEHQLAYALPEKVNEFLKTAREVLGRSKRHVARE
jgi:hypothetical protein